MTLRTDTSIDCFVGKQKLKSRCNCSLSIVSLVDYIISYELLISKL